MVTFNNSLDTAVEKIKTWRLKEELTQVTIIRDVYGRLSFLMDNRQSMSADDKQEFSSLMAQNLGNFFNGEVYWKKLPHAQKTEKKRISLIAEIIESERFLWKTEENIDFYISERPIAKKSWLKHELQDSAWPYDEAIAENGMKIAAFYSFKGGMGRTTTLAAVALNLISHGNNVMMIDTDIEAPGLATLFFDEEVIHAGVLDYLLEHEINNSVNIQNYILDVTDPALLNDGDGNLYLMPAGKVDTYYLQKLARIDYQDHRENHLRDSIVTLLKDIKENYMVDYILIDARSGFHDLGGIAVSQIPHASVLFSNNSRQSWDGISQVLSAIARTHSADFPVMLVDTMCEKPTSPNYAVMKNRFIEKAYATCVDNFYDINDTIPGLDAEGVAHSPEFVYFNDELRQGIELYSNGSQEENERVAAFKNHLNGECYKKITNRIRGWFGDEETEH